jgi:hypothetical protein
MIKLLLKPIFKLTTIFLVVVNCTKFVLLKFKNNSFAPSHLFKVVKTMWMFLLRYVRLEWANRIQHHQQKWMLFKLFKFSWLMMGHRSKNCNEILGSTTWCNVSISWEWRVSLRGDSSCIIYRALRSRHCLSVPSQLNGGGIINKVYLYAYWNKVAPIDGGLVGAGEGEGLVISGTYQMDQTLSESQRLLPSFRMKFRTLGDKNR